MLSGLLMIIPTIFSDGNNSLIAIGVMFLIFGIVFLGSGRADQREPGRRGC